MENPDSALRAHWVEQLCSLGSQVDRDTARSWVSDLPGAKVAGAARRLMEVAQRKENPASYAQAGMRAGWADELVQDVPEDGKAATTFAEGMAIAESFDGGPYFALTDEKKTARLRAYREFRKTLPRVALGEFGSEHVIETEGGNRCTLVVNRGATRVCGGRRIPVWETIEGTQVMGETYPFPEYPMIWVHALQARPAEELIQKVEEL